MVDKDVHMILGIGTSKYGYEDYSLIPSRDNKRLIVSSRCTYGVAKYGDNTYITSVDHVVDSIIKCERPMIELINSGDNISYYDEVGRYILDNGMSWISKKNIEANYLSRLRTDYFKVRAEKTIISREYAEKLASDYLYNRKLELKSLTIDQDNWNVKIKVTKDEALTEKESKTIKRCESMIRVKCPSEFRQKYIMSLGRELVQILSESLNWFRTGKMTLKQDENTVMIMKRIMNGEFLDANYNTDEKLLRQFDTLYRHTKCAFDRCDVIKEEFSEAEQKEVKERVRQLVADK